MIAGRLSSLLSQPSGWTCAAADCRRVFPLLKTIAALPNGRSQGTGGSSARCSYPIPISERRGGSDRLITPRRRSSGCGN